MKWITRQSANVDCIACPWTIKRFVDSEAEFLYVSDDEVMTAAGARARSPTTCRMSSPVM